MSSLTYTATFDCPRDRVWPYLVEPEKTPLWMKGVVESRLTSDGPPRAGSTFLMRIREGRKIADYRGEYLVVEPGKRLGLRITGGCFREGMEMRVNYRLSDAGERTCVDYECACEAKGFLMRLLGPLFRAFARMQVKGFFRALKGLVETPNRDGEPASRPTA